MPKSPDNHILVIFGASGDLTYRKLIPSLYDLYAQSLLPTKFGVLGLGRTELSDQKFREKMADGIRKFALRNREDEAGIAKFCEMLHYYAFNTQELSEYHIFKTKLLTLAFKLGTGANFIFYLATPPNLYSVIPANLAAVGLHNEENGFTRLIIEKPFGYDLETAQKLNRQLKEHYQESQLYRIDHYLGKETVQNLLVTRFSNGMFEPIWNHNFVDHVEITSSEKIGVGKRGGYYETSGAMRDMVQNHLLLCTGLVAMEPPAAVDADSIRNEISKVFQALRPIADEDINNQVIRGQYTRSHIKGEEVNGYREEEGVNPESRTETFVAMKFYIDNWRWAGVPFYIRSGKMLPTQVTELVIHFKPAPHRLFGNDMSAPNPCNQLVIRIQPDEGILFKFGIKAPGSGFQVQDANMNFRYSDLTDTYLPSAYERLLLDAMLGDATLYSRGDMVEAAWKFIDPILKFWEKNPETPVHGYPAGTWGPSMADALIEGKDRTWRYPCKNLTNDGTYCEL